MAMMRGRGEEGGTENWQLTFAKVPVAVAVPSRKSQVEVQVEVAVEVAIGVSVGVGVTQPLSQSPVSSTPLHPLYLLSYPLCGLFCAVNSIVKVQRQNKT